MDYDQVMMLADEYEEALADELQAKWLLDDFRARILETEGCILGLAYKSGRIDGKNADARKRQELAVLLGDEGLEELKRTLPVYEASAMRAEVRRKAADTHVSLTKAWLFSQCRVG